MTRIADTVEEEYQEARDELPELSHFASLRLSEVPNTRGPGSARASVMSSDEASSTIDSFFKSRSKFIKNKDNKLKLWQALCVELGLVAAEDDQKALSIAAPKHAGNKYNSKKKNKKTAKFSPMPTSLTQANILLHQRAHVNINDYLALRSTPLPAGSNYRRDLSVLVYPTAKAMINYTVETCNFTPKKLAEDEWLQPLMRDMGK